MARFARAVVPEVPHHVTARGNRREPSFLEDGDQDVYCDMLAEQTHKAGVQVWAYRLMPNHLRLILTPTDAAGLARALGEAHRRYAVYVNARSRWTGHLFDGRHAATPMDESHLLSAVRYVSLNPVRARLVAQAVDWPWSSVRAHLRGQDDGLAVVRPVLDRVETFAGPIEADDEARHARRSRRCARRSAPAGAGKRRHRHGPRNPAQASTRKARPRAETCAPGRRPGRFAVNLERVYG
jgi:putative transposase